MDRYVVLVVDDNEDLWETFSDAEKDKTYAADAEFVRLLQERGGKVVGGQELTHSQRTRVLARDDGGGVLVSDGPFAETAEQIAGFYIVECESLDDLTDAARAMVPAHLRLEVRPVPTDA